MNGLPQLPPGFVLDDEPAPIGAMPPLPPGFELEPDQPQTFGGAAMNATAGVNEALYGALGAPVDLVRGGMNLATRGINAVAGTDIPQIPEDSFGGSRSIANAMGAIRPELDPANTKAETSNDRIARGVGQGVGGAVLPAGAVGAAKRAGVAVSPLVEAMAGRSGSVGAVSADAVAGGAAGAGSATAQEFTSDKFDPLSGLAGGIVGGGLGAVATGIPVLTRAVAEATGNFTAPMRQAGRERLAGERLVDAASDPRAAMRKLDEVQAPLVPGSNPTTFQATGDMGLGALEREAQTRSPADFMQRRADQNTARREALEGIQPDGAPEQVSRVLRDQFKALDAETAKAVDDARTWEEGARRSLGSGQRPEDAGDAARQSLQRNRDAAMERENRLWGAVDPDGTLGLPPQDTKRVAQEIVADLPKLAKPPSSEESAIYSVIGDVGDVVSFKELSAYRSRVSQAIADERARSGKSPAWARLVQLRGAIESDLENAVSRKVLVEEQAVAAGQMREEDTLLANMKKQQEQWYAERAEASSGNGGGATVGGRGTGRPPAAVGISGAAGETSQRLGPTSGDPRLSQDAGRGSGQNSGLTAADIRAKKPNDPFFVRSGDNQSFVPVAPGKPDLGTAPNLRGGGDLPIRVRRGDFTKHIASPVHYSDAEILGYSDPWEMLTDISGTWTEMRRGDKGRILLVKPAPELNGVAAVELAKVDGADYWRVVTAGRRREDQLGDRLAVRERTPDGRSGNDLPLVRRPTETGQEQHFARAASSPDNSAPGAPEQGFRPFDAEAKGRLDTATEATRQRAATFDNRQLGPLLARPADHSPYNVESARVAARVFQPGASGFERVQQYRGAAGPEGMAAIEAYAVDSLRKAAIDRDTGQINPAKLESWRRSHADALRAFPELDIKIGTAGDAARAVEQAATARKAALDETQRGALGRLIGVEDPESVRNIVGGLFSRQDAAEQLATLRRRVGGDKDAQQGLRKAVADHVMTRFVSNTEAATSGRELLRADQLQTFVKTNRNALRAVFTEPEVNVLEAVAADLQRANRSNASVKIPNQSNTAQDQRSILQNVMNAGLENWTTVAGGTAGAAVAGAPGALAGGGLAALFNAMRLNGINSVDELVRDALLNPERARFLMAKVPTDQRQADFMFGALARRYVKAATVGAAVDPKDEKPKRGPVALPPWMTQAEPPSALQRALAER
ncbi:hypothetical protein [Aureimonas sp. N4]|uniref:hypothetical protein n=1 Tax=Aureimonas sp. N4 TaxID=1638165 RepID=UPI0007846E76|nr:hypothetical protein [Aureimonas sp. N4]